MMIVQIRTEAERRLRLFTRMGNVRSFSCVQIRTEAERRLRHFPESAVCYMAHVVVQIRPETERRLRLAN